MILSRLFSGLLATTLLIGCSDGASNKIPADVPALTSVPLTISKACERGRAYDPCIDQKLLFAQALSLAEEQGKTVLVNYGADWCIWCHVLDQHLKGGVDRFTYEFGDYGEVSRYTMKERSENKARVLEEAEALARFASDRFVVVHIDGNEAPGGREVLKMSAADTHYNGGLPFAFTVKKSGTFAAKMPSNLETRRDDDYDWYRGYDRAKLLAALQDMDAAALTASE